MHESTCFVIPFTWITSPVSNLLLLSNEAGVSQNLSDNVINPLYNLFQRTGFGKELSFSPQVRLVTSIVDYVVMKNTTKLFPIEIKLGIRWAFNDLVTRYNEDDSRNTTPSGLRHSPVQKAISQVFGYMVRGEFRYGSLCTYDRTWFLYRPVDAPNSLLISIVFG